MAVLEKKKSDLKIRCLSGAVIILLTLALIYAGRQAFTGFVVVLGAMSTFEWARMLIEKPKSGIYEFSAILGALVLAATIYMNSMTTAPMIILFGAMFLGIFMHFRSFDVSFGKVLGGFFYILFSLSYVGLLMMYAGKDVPGPIGSPVFVPFDQDALKILVAFLFVTVWASDSIAYVFGRLIGGPKLAPKISPKKTWAGMLGSMTGAAAALYLGGYIIEQQFGIKIAETLDLVLFGAFLGVVGQVGDLAISVFKRAHNVKDTGNVIPGHGGVLDRIDALLLIAPFYVYAVMAVV